MLTKHHYAQWRSTKTPLLALASVPEVSASFAKWLLNLSAENKTIRRKLHNDATHLPSLIACLTDDACLSNLTSQELFASHEKDTKKSLIVRNHLNHRIRTL